MIVAPYELRSGSASVGLPMCFSAEVLLERYVDLLQVARTGSPDGTAELRDDDFEVLARATGLEVDAVRARVERLLAERNVPNRT